MFKLLLALLGLAVIGALFAGIYYAPANHAFKEEGVPAFNPAPGEVRTFGLQPSVEGGVIRVVVEVQEGVVDVYLMEREWAMQLPVPGENRLSLDRPFNFLAEHSAMNVSGTFEAHVISDGVTWYTLVIDHSDNYYANDTAPGEEPARVSITTRYVTEEKRTLTLGYLAAIPSILLVVVTLGRQTVRKWKAR